MNKLYTYGCSFTQGMWEFDSTEEGEVEYRGWLFKSSTIQFKR